MVSSSDFYKSVKVRKVYMFRTLINMDVFGFCRMLPVPDEQKESYRNKPKPRNVFKIKKPLPIRSG